MEEHNCCDKLMRMMGEFLDGEIETECCEEFEKHVEKCEKCSIVLRTTQTTIEIYQEHYHEHVCDEIPDGIRHRVYRSIRERLVFENLIEEL